MSMQVNKNDSPTQKIPVETVPQYTYYPIDMSSYLTELHDMVDTTDALCHENLSQQHPTIIAHRALAHWNRYLSTDEDDHFSVFLSQAQWFVENETSIGDGASSWPIFLPHQDVHGSGSWLSARTQGSVLSVLVRAYQSTRDTTFLALAQRAVRTFERDILDEGINAPIGEQGIFFEEIAVYPASHSLIGCLFALYGLYDYTSLINDTHIQQLIQRGNSTLHTLLDEFDCGFWTRSDLLHPQLSTVPQLTLQTELLEALVTYSGCEHCSTLAVRWKGYRRRLSTRLRYEIIGRCILYTGALLKRIQSILFPKPQVTAPLRVCVPIHAFPVTGGTRAVLAGIAQVTADNWQIEYLTQYVGPNSEGLSIYRFGTARMAPWQFPMVWFYSFAGWWKLIALMRHKHGYQVILPQDGVFTAAFAALAAKAAGVRVVCIDHGNLTLLNNSSYRTERLAALTAKNWSQPRRILARLRYIGYWPSLALLARISARFVDHYLIPGVPGDGTEEICKRLGVPASRLTRFDSVIDTQRYLDLDASAKAILREKYSIAADDIVIAMTCRLAPEKGIDVALDAMCQALSEFSQEVRTRVRLIIAGDGPLRAHIEEIIRTRGLEQTCILWGETSTLDVISLLGISDIFLYTSIRGACLSMAVLEAMASGCAVIASIRPLSNEKLLAEGRGIAIPAEDVEQASAALARLVNDVELRHHMGRAARGYVAAQHNATKFKRVLMRATYWTVSTKRQDSGRWSKS